MNSFDDAQHILRVRGSAFFSLPFAETDRPQTRILSRNGTVELSSGSGRFWMRAYLFVDDHPYYTRTGPDGQFLLEQVPEGDYELSVWMPSWRVAWAFDDPGWTLTSEMAYRPPLEFCRKVSVRRGRVERVEVEASTQDFDR